MKRLIFLGVGVCLLVLAQGKPAAAITINFDVAADGVTAVASGTNINSVYNGLGVTFSSVVSASLNAYAVTALNPATADAGHGNVVSLFDTAGFGSTFAAEEGAVKATFSTLQSDVSIDARMIEAIEILGNNSRTAFLEAFDSSNNLLGSVVHYPFTWETAGIWDTTHSAPWETLSISHSTADISYVLFSSQANCLGCTRGQGGVFSEFDNLTFGAPGNGGGNGAVPEPASLLLLGAGFAGLAALRRRLKA